MERLELARRLGFLGSLAEPTGVATVVEERDPAAFIAAFARAAAGDGPVFLADPAWGRTERAALAELAGRTDRRPPGRGWLMIPSGGTGGRLKFARHDEETLSAAVRGFCAHFQAGRVHCVGILPLHHVSGLMAWMRSALSGGRYLPWDWKRLEGEDRPPLSRAPREQRLGPGAPDRWYISLVPTQLQRLLASPAAVEWLRKFDAVFVGGGPLWPDLADAAARARLPVSTTYGMTETAAMAAALRPEEFLAGDRSSGTPLPHAAIDLTAEGLVRVAGESVFRGYFPDFRRERSFTTEDLGAIDGRGRLRILGRRDAVIITGGKKVDPQEVEAALLASGEFADVAVVGVPDPEWGAAAVACYPANQPAPDMERVAVSLSALAGFKRPRRYRAIEAWPRNAQGKLNRVELARRAASP